MPVFTTACPRNCYSTCSMKVFVQDGRLRMIEPHPDNAATPEGICLKGLSYVERVYSKDRLLYPYKKKSDGNFERISWREAIDIIISNLIFFREKFGPQSIMYYNSSGTKGLLNSVGLNFWRLFGGCTTTFGDLCWPAGLEATRLTLGDNKHNAPWDIENAKLIILWGKNAAETNVHQMYYIDKALEKGAKMIVIDPRRTQSAERAFMLIQPRPGTDAAMALAIANYLIKNQLIDTSFIQKHVKGFEKFKKSVQDFTLEKAARICQIPAEHIKNLALHTGTIKPLSINAGYGMQRYTNSGQTIRTIIALLAITGNIGKPGAGWIYANLLSHIFDDVKDPLAFYPPEKQKDNIRVSVSTTRLGYDMLAQSNPALKMSWVERGNPVTQNPDTHSVLKAFRSLKFRVVVDQFMTDTAREADLVLPAKTMFEQSDVINAYWHSYIQLKQKVIEPPGEVKPESEIYYLLAKKLGFAHEEMRDKIPAPGDKVIEDFLSDKLNPFPDLNLEKLKKGPILVGHDQEIAFNDFAFSTPSGKIELYSEQAQKMWGVNLLPDFTEAAESVVNNKKFKLHFLTPNTKNRIHSQFNNLSLIRQYSVKPYVFVHPDNAAERDIQDGDLVRIFNDRGGLKLPVRLDFAIRKDCISVSNGWWISEGGTVNFLSAARETDMGYGAAFHDNLVEIQKI